MANKAAELIRCVPEGFHPRGPITRLSSMMRWGEQAADCRAFARGSQPKGEVNKPKAAKLTHRMRRGTGPDGAISGDHGRTAGHAGTGRIAPCRGSPSCCSCISRS